MTADLETVVPEHLWSATSRLRGVGVRTRMTCVRRPDGSLWVHSPIALTPALVARLAELGPVTDVVAPNRFHHLFFRDFLTQFPSARGHVARGLGDKIESLRDYPCVTTSHWPGLRRYDIEGIPALQESVWFHEETGTLILTDLLFCFGRDNPLAVRCFAALSGVYRNLRMSRAMRWWMVRDRAALRASVQPLIDLPVQRIVVAHDTIVDTNAPDSLAAAFGWLP